MPLSLAFAVIAVVAALAMQSRQAADGRGRQFAGRAVAMWVAMVILAVIVLTLATLIFGR